MALVQCRECRKDISDQAQRCPSCGAPTTPKKIKAGPALTALFIGGAAVLMVRDCSSHNNPQERLATGCSQSNASMAFIMATNHFVRDELAAPSTAEFTQSDVKYLGNCSFSVSGYVDAQNAFGAKLRHSFSANVRYNPDDDTCMGYNLHIND